MADLNAIRYIVDENTLALGKVIAELRDDTAVIGLPPVNQLLRRGMNDIEWIPVVGYAAGWSSRSITICVLGHTKRTSLGSVH